MDEISRLAPEYLKDLNRFINLSTLENNEALIYALAQCMYDRVELMDISDDQKGGILSHIMGNMAEFGKEKLALYYMRRQAIIDMKSSTIQ